MHSTVQILRSRSAIDEISADWNALLRSGPADTIFLTWEWISSWLDCVDNHANIALIVVRDTHGKLTGVAPFYSTRMKLLRAWPLNCLRIIGDYRSGSEYADLITGPDDAPAVLDAIMEALSGRAVAWDCLWLPRMAGWTGGHDRLIESCRRAGLYVHTRESPFSAAALPSTIEEYMSSLSGNKRSALRRQINRITKTDGVKFTICEDPADCRRYLDALYRLHHLRWRTAGEEGGFVKPGVVEFYERFVPLALRRGWTKLYAIEDRGEIKAVQVGYVYNNVLHQMQEGYDPDYTDGVGNVLRYLAIEECIRQGVTCYDFLGGFTEHKRRWGATQRVGHDVFIGRRSLKNSMLFSQNVWPSGRFMVEDNPVERACRGRGESATRFN